MFWGFGFRVSGFGFFGLGFRVSGFGLKRGTLGRNVKRFRGGLVLKAHRLLYHSTLGSRVIKKKKVQGFGLRVEGGHQAEEGSKRSEAHTRKSGATARGSSV